MRFAAGSLVLMIVAITIVAESPRVLAADFTVDSTTDAVDASPGDGICATADGECTLRAAIQEADATPGADTITVPEGVYTLAIAGADEQEGATGDLDVHEDLTIRGAGRDETVLDGGGLDRVLQVGVGVSDPIAFSLQDLTIRHGVANAGGGVNVGRAVTTIERVAFLDNESTSDGGGLYVHGTGAALTVRDSLFQGNVAAGAGGGFFADGDTTVSGTQALANRATSGGGIRINDAVLTIDASTVANNSANGTGGIDVFRSGALIATNVTVSGNDTQKTGPGAVSVPGDTSILTHVTIANNGPGRGISGNNNTIELRSSIVANNAQEDCATTRLTVIATGANLDTDGSCGVSLTADPALAPLAYWGGPPGMLTHALGSLSPAIDAALSCGADTDQRGEPRPQGDACDLGAYEATPAEMVEVVYPSGFSTLGWVGGAATVEEAFADVLDQLEGVWAWDAQAQEFLTWRPNVPAALNTLTTLAPGTGLWMRLTDGGAASVPTLGEGDAFVTGDAFGAVVVPTERLAAGGGCTAPERTLATGFNLVAWQGGTADAADALAGLGATLQGAWLWDGASESYLTYNPTLPAALNSLAEIRAGQSLWLRVAATTVLTGPPAC